MAGSLRLHFLRREDLNPLKYSLSFREIPQKCGVFCLKMAIFGSFFISFLDLFQNTPNKWVIPLIKPLKYPSPDKKSGIFCVFRSKNAIFGSFLLMFLGAPRAAAPQAARRVFPAGYPYAKFSILGAAFWNFWFFPETHPSRLEADRVPWNRSGQTISSTIYIIPYFFIKIKPAGSPATASSEPRIDFFKKILYNIYVR